jgi:hypothetical protein
LRAGGAVPALPGKGPHSSRGSRSKAAQRHTQTSTNGDNDHGLGTDAADIWTPEPPTPALGRKRKVAVLIAAAMLEISMTGKILKPQHNIQQCEGVSCLQVYSPGSTEL